MDYLDLLIVMPAVTLLLGLILVLVVGSIQGNDHSSADTETKIVQMEHDPLAFLKFT